jgi:hypothetical protein
MHIGRVQAILSIIVVASFVLVTGIIALTPVVGGYPPAPFTEHLKTFSSLYSGVVGIVIGFYFGRKQTDQKQSQ